ncbi:hypothetical protein NRY95_21420 [Xanthomonas campestris pv. phormiicola]|nr:hypothetical protein [Xanthomonas campestris pv. phormiicola]UYC16203.1 hypothetical protein NRY95_21420 [Xanthomonas campestris pv. phormiicola]
MKRFFLGALLCICAMPSYAEVCTVEGKVATLIPSQGVAGLSIASPISGCSCDFNMLWIDTNVDGGKAMYAAALGAKFNGTSVRATIQDGQGNGAQGNQAITYRYWATCKLMALELL